MAKFLESGNDKEEIVNLDLVEYYKVMNIAEFKVIIFRFASTNKAEWFFKTEEELNKKLKQIKYGISE